jgi:hypothetical protein
MGAAFPKQARLKVLGSWPRVLILLISLLLLGTAAWWLLLRMPGKNVANAAALSAAELSLRDELRADVRTLAAEIGERNVPRYPKLKAAAEFIESSFVRAGLQPRRDAYEVDGLACDNIEAEIHGAFPQIVLIGAHYDSVFGGPGANDNGSGVAAVLALARRFAKKQPTRTLRFVAFVNEEPPYFQTSNMGSLIYAGRCKARGDQISAMISLETIGYFCDAPRSQTYPVPGLGAFYPPRGNFIGFVANVRSRQLLRRAIALFREQEKLPSEGAALPSFLPGVSWSDQWSFWQHGYPAIMITDTALFRYSHYHQPTDTPDKLDYDRFALVVSGVERVIADLAGAPP